MFETSLESCRFVSAHWYRGLARGLRRAWAEQFEGGAEALLGPLAPAGATLFAGEAGAGDAATETPDGAPEAGLIRLPDRLPDVTRNGGRR